MFPISDHHPFAILLGRKVEYIAAAVEQLQKCPYFNFGQSDIINNLVTVKEMQNFGFLGYCTGENRYTYPKFGKAKAEDLLNALCKLADYVIVDCTSDLEGNILASACPRLISAVSAFSSLSFRFIPTADSAWKTTFRG